MSDKKIDQQLQKFGEACFMAGFERGILLGTLLGSGSMFVVYIIMVL